MRVSGLGLGSRSRFLRWRNCMLLFFGDGRQTIFARRNRVNAIRRRRVLRLEDCLFGSMLFDPRHWLRDHLSDASLLQIGVQK